MSDSHSEYQYDYSTRGPYGAFRRTSNAFGAAFIGFLLFIASFGILYWNETQVDSSKIANKAYVINAEKEVPNSNLENKVVMITGNVSSDEEIGDNLYLKPDNLIAYNRKVEMYAWVESKTTRNYEELDGTTVKKTTYSYNKQWKENPQNSNNFKDSIEHENPIKRINNDVKKAESVKIGDFRIMLKDFDYPPYERLNLSEENIQLSNDITIASNQYLFMGRGSLQAPQLGDTRISYTVIKSGFSGTALGKYNNEKIESYFDQKTGKNLSRLFKGGIDEAVGKMKTEYTQRLWIFRGVGLFIMWLGICMFFEPLNASLHIFPVVGSFLSSIAGVLTGFISLIISIVLTAITIFVVNILKNIYVLIGVIIVSFAICLYIIKIVGKTRNKLPV